MNARQSRRLHSLERAIECIEAWTPTPAPAAWTRQVDALRAAHQRVIDASTHQDVHYGSGRAARDAQAAAVRTLREFHLNPLRTLAYTMADEMTGIEMLFKLPDVGVPVSELLGKARSVTQAAERHRDLFVDLGRPANFIDQLQGAIAAVEALTEQRTTHRRSRVGATVRVAQSLRAGRRAIAVLGVLVNDVHRDNPAALQAWARASRIGGRGRANEQDLPTGQGQGRQAAPRPGLAVVRGTQPISDTARAEPTEGKAGAGSRRKARNQARASR